MRPEYIALFVTTLIGIAWLFFVPPYLFKDILPVNLQNSADWLDRVYGRSAIAILIICLAFTLFWIFAKSMRSRFTRSREARSQQILWWILAIVLALLCYGIYLIFEFSYTPQLQSGQTIIHSAPYLPMAAMVVADVVLLYWLPTALATLGTLRFVPPLSMGLRSLFLGGR